MNDKQKKIRWGTSFVVVAVLALLPACHKKIEPQDATYQGYPERLKNDPDFAQKEKLNNARLDTALNKMRHLGEIGLPGDVITIPVVVHIISGNGAPDISPATVEQQIADLTRDFRRQNTAEIAALPEAFRTLATDTRIQFQLAGSTPDRDSSTGIYIFDTNRNTPFEYKPLAASPQERNPVKFAATGGAAAWPAEHYLNIWVAALDGQLGAGYASLHPDYALRPAEDGVVISAGHFQGRALTNLVGKWLGLQDLWGAGSVAGSDGVDDTPPQEAPNHGCPVFPLHNRPASPYGDLFCNFMDATDDNCRVMFTAGQADRMYAGFKSFRPAAFWGSAFFLFPPMPNGINAEYMIQDNATDTGGEPNMSTTNFFHSPDIVVNQNGGSMDDGAPMGGIDNSIDVRIHNIGGNTDPGAAVRHFNLYIRKFGTGGGLPVAGAAMDVADANGWVHISPADKSFNHISTGLTDIQTFTRHFDAAAAGTFDHYCLMAVLNNVNCTQATRAACGTESGFVEYNKKVGWRNVDVAGPNSVPRMEVGNVMTDPSLERLLFKAPDDEKSVFEYGRVIVSSKRLAELWTAGGSQGEGVVLRDTQLIIQKDGAFITNLLVPGGEMIPVALHFEPHADLAKGRELYAVDVFQSDADEQQNYKPGGGVSLILKKEHAVLPPAPPPPGRPWWWWLVAALIAGLGIYGWRKMKQGA